MSMKIKQYPYNQLNNNEKMLRNVGEIVASTIPLVDAGLHSLDGSIIQGKGIYKEFVHYIVNLSDKHPEFLCSNDEFEQSLTDYGVCGKYVYDNEADTLRLPKITGFIEGTAYLNRVGNIEAAGLPNVKGTIRWMGTGGLEIANGVFKSGKLSGNGASHQSFSQDEARSVEFSNAFSNPIYKDNYNKVQPQSVKVLYYVVVTASAKTDIKLSIDNIMADFDTKAENDFTNAVPNQSFIDKAMNWNLPDYSAGINKSIGVKHIAETDGYVCFCALGNSSIAAMLKINNNRVFYSAVNSGASDYSGSYLISKGDSYILTSADNNYFNSFLTFYPLKGVTNA